MIAKTIDLNHVRGADAPESKWLVANGLDIAMIPISQVATIERDSHVDESAREMLCVVSFLKDASGLNVTTVGGHIKAPIRVRLKSQPESFGINPTIAGV